MSDIEYTSADLEDPGVLDPADTLDGDDLTADPLDRGFDPPESWSPGEGYGTTLAEERAGESLDQLLAEEEPDTEWYGREPADTSRCAEEAAMHVISDKSAARIRG